MEPSSGNNPEREPPERPSGRQLVGNAAVLYPVMALAALAGSWLFLDRAPWTDPEHEGVVGLPLKVALGAGVGVGVFALDQLAERLLKTFRQMSEAFQGLLGGLGPTDALLLALLSSIGEELLFRGFLQVWLGLIPASLIFGLMHLAPDRRLWPWPLLAIGMGFAFGGLFQYTGDVLAPVLAHFTINYFSLTLIARRASAGRGEG